MRFAIALGLWLALGAGLATAEPPIGLAVNESDAGDYGEALALADEAGFSMTLLPLFWDDMMRDGAHYVPTPDWPRIADLTYAEIGWNVAVVLSVIDTTEDRRPEALRGLAWDDPAVIAAFRTYAEGVFAGLKTVPILSVSVGNEVDVRLAQTGEWEAYGRFLTEARAIVADLRPGVPVGTTLTWAELTGGNASQARALGAAGEIWLITWYPLGPGFRTLSPKVVAPTLGAMVALADGRPLALSETGFPAQGCGAAPGDQADVVAALLDGIDRHEGAFVYANFVWMHDLPESAARELAAYYGVDDPCFLAYLASLGLRSAAGEDKPAFDVLRDRLAD